MPIRVLITAGTRADCSEAIELIKNIDAGDLLVDRGYDSDEIIEFVEQNGMITVIPPRKNRKEQRFYDKDLYILRHIVENAFLKPEGGVALLRAIVNVPLLFLKIPPAFNRHHNSS